MQKENLKWQLANAEEDAAELFLVNSEHIDEKLRAFVHCSLVYISTMLQKMRQSAHEFFIEVKMETTASGSWKSVHLIYHITGHIVKGAAWKACHQSIHKYCPLAQAIQKSGAKISWEIKVVSPD